MKERIKGTSRTLRESGAVGSKNIASDGDAPDSESGSKAKSSERVKAFRSAFNDLRISLEGLNSRRSLADPSSTATGIDVGRLRAARRVVVIGPIVPYRSGIAKHTTMLCQSLASRGDVELRVLSFRRQYPAKLFPGESDRDPDADPPEQLSASYSIDSLNPLSWLEAVREISSFEAELVIIPWWTSFLAPCFWSIARSCQRRGIDVRFICHNAYDHEDSFLKRWLARVTLRKGSSFLVHNEALAQRVRDLVPGAAVSTYPHPIFDHYPTPSRRLPRRADLELLYFGLVRPYKGLDVAIDALHQLRDKSVHLSIVGEFWTGQEETRQRIEALGLADRIEFVPRYVSDVEAADYFDRADAVVLPYRSATGSGVVPVAYHYSKPVIVSDLPGLTDVVRQGETGFVFPAGDSLALAGTIADQVTAARCASMGPAIEAIKESMCWPAFAGAALAGLTPNEPSESSVTQEASPDSTSVRDFPAISHSEQAAGDTPLAAVAERHAGERRRV